MKTSNKLIYAVGALMMAGSIHAWSQSSETVPASGAAVDVASGASDQKSTKQADRALRKKVYAAIAKVKAIDAGNISIRAKNGAVTLFGTVEDGAQVTQVADIARNVPGVTSVVNKLTVTRPFGGQ
ncbi:BON domain-containing protein [Paraburkholderia humisilvae]|uniref:BON domain-containing protein n=1 Tax=Paraburkholderia humisilvae TaxID=627669 RepID=A0A6J5ERC8_9BURK|nr:BON domain-containing protein [Paraburkholderia humisilvae]CAB3769049.1 hypothetical protein LMG29542_06021 [Paraburkholderia humisilvae]